MLKVLDVDGAVRRVRGGWEATGEPWAYDAERYAPGQPRPASASSRRCSTTSTPTGAGCGSCATSSTTRPSTAHEPAGAATAAAASTCRDRGLRRRRRARPRARLARPGVVVEPRKMWPTALANLGLDLKGKIAEGAEPGRAVARLTDLGHGQALRELFRRRAARRPGARCRWCTR